jgi:hypothetical protein
MQHGLDSLGGEPVMVTPEVVGLVGIVWLEDERETAFV